MLSLPAERFCSSQLSSTVNFMIQHARLPPSIHSRVDGLSSQPFTRSGPAIQIERLVSGRASTSSQPLTTGCAASALGGARRYKLARDFPLRRRGGPEKVGVPDQVRHPPTSSCSAVALHSTVVALHSTSVALQAGA